jgi:hypothetical protein
MSTLNAFQKHLLTSRDFAITEDAKVYPDKFDNELTISEWDGRYVQKCRLIQESGLFYLSKPVFKMHGGLEHHIYIYKYEESQNSFIKIGSFSTE